MAKPIIIWCFQLHIHLVGIFFNLRPNLEYFAQIYGLTARIFSDGRCYSDGSLSLELNHHYFGSVWRFISGDLNQETCNTRPRAMHESPLTSEMTQRP